jgi:transposase
MAMLSFCGIDVSKDRLDVMVLPEQQCSSVRNDVAGWAELVERLRGFSISAIGLEASGGYERGIMRALGGRLCRFSLHLGAVSLV